MYIDVEKCLWLLIVLINGTQWQASFSIFSDWHEQSFDPGTALFQRSADESLTH